MKKIALILFLIISNYSFSQSMKWLVKSVTGEVSVLDFTTTPPTLGAQILNYGLGAEEEINIMTDISNNILFTSACNSSDIIQVRDANFNPMPNGTIRGSNTSFESAICKIPCTDNSYYFFNYKGPIGQDSLFYSIIDLNLNGGLGDVSQRNIYLGSGYTEGMTVSHQMRNGCRWLIVPGYSNNNFTVSAFKISHDGISPPIILDSQVMVNPIMRPHEIELSMDNLKLTVSTFSTGNIDPDIICYNFDLENGSVFNKQTFNVSLDWVLGVEFSPDASKIYYQTNTSFFGTSVLGRIDLISGANQIIDNSRDQYLTDPELAGNGKIYIGWNYTNNYISEIGDPNNSVVGNIQYIRNSIFVNFSGCRPGFVNCIDGEPPGTSIIPSAIDFSYSPTLNCGDYQFIDSTCIGSWWEWNFGDSIYSNLQDPLHHYNTSGNYNVTLRVKICSDTLTITKSINVISNSFVLSVSPDAIICNGSSANLIAAGGNDYEWSPGTGLNITTGNFVVATPDSTTTYTVNATNGNSCSSSATVTVYAVHKTVSINSTINNACSGTNISLIANWNGIGNILWSDGNTNDTIYVTQSGTYTVQVSDSGCSDYDSIMVNFYNSPNPLISTSSNSTCQGDTVILSLNTQFLTQQWYFNNIILTNDTSSNITAFSSGDYSVTVTDLNGCTETAYIPLTFFSKPIAQFSTISNPCVDSILMQNNSINSSQYQWYKDEILVDTTSDPYLYFTTIGNHTIKLVASNGNCSDTLIQTILTSINPSASFYTDSICSLTQTFHNTSSNSNQYFWLSGMDTISIQFEPILTFQNYGSLIVKLIAMNLSGCIDSIEKEINMVHNVPSSFDYILDTCANELLLSPINSDAFLYDWNIDNEIISSIQNPSIENILSGNHVISLTVNSGFSCQEITTRNIEIAEIPKTHFYIPNTFTPNGDGINEDFLIFGLGYCDSYELYIYDRWGQLLFETNNQGPIWNGTFNNKKVEEGVYCYLIKFNDTYLQGRITVLY